MVERDRLANKSKLEGIINFKNSAPNFNAHMIKILQSQGIFTLFKGSLLPFPKGQELNVCLEFTF